RGRGGGDGRQVRRHRATRKPEADHFAYSSWLLTWVFMSRTTFAAGSLPLRNSSSVGCTIRLIWAALVVMGYSTVWRDFTYDRNALTSMCCLAWVATAFGTSALIAGNTTACLPTMLWQAGLARKRTHSTA